MRAGRPRQRRDVQRAKPTVSFPFLLLLFLPRDCGQIDFAECLGLYLPSRLLRIYSFYRTRPRIPRLNHDPFIFVRRVSI